MPRSIASHLDIVVDPNNPPPAASHTFVKICLFAAKIWKKFEEAEALLPPLDDLVNAEILDYVSTHRRATGQELAIERARRTVRLYPQRILQASESCQELELAIAVLDEAARKEPETLEGRATSELDLDVMNNCLATTRETIKVAQNQLDRATTILHPS